MKPSLQKLVSIGGGSISPGPITPHSANFDAFGGLGDQLVEFLQASNGLYAFESALHLFPAGSGGEELSLTQWNASDLWRQEYGEFAEGLMFFAEDAFGNQFCINRAGVHLF